VPEQEEYGFDQAQGGGAAYDDVTPQDQNDPEPLKISPRGLEIAEGRPPFQDPLFDQMVREEMEKMEREIQNELQHQSQVLEEMSITPEGKRMVDHMVDQERENGPSMEDYQNHPYAARPEDLQYEGSLIDDQYKGEM